MTTGDALTKVDADPDVQAIRKQPAAASGRSQIALNAQLNALPSQRYGQ